MKELYEKHRILIKIASLICVVILIWGVLLIADAVERGMRSLNASEEVIIHENRGEIKSYDVNGLTDEEIERLLELERLNGGNK